ncbi:hypothetical protein MLD38_024125 [Melastoma candidum]|uniref:Uncharacterized protein n=1 Tax=Melastoma candidum TaxID=119954 RepID=A0ACB9NUB6_9MYRT|nr:hypothetical protein MLD38_024125 [Melastoma candidum]
MWPLRRINTTPPSPRSTPFSCSSFKDVQSLCAADDEDDDVRRRPQPHSPVASSPRSSPTAVFQRIRISASSLALRHATYLPTSRSKFLQEERITVYFTSLRVVRKTYEESRAVRSILRGYRVPMDERDLSMDSQYVAELRGMLGGRSAIPCVFVGRRCVVGAEEVRRLHESGELGKMIAGVRGGAGGRGDCGGCGGMRYVVCGVCHGGRKLYVDKSGFRSCDSCNVNGLVRCSLCMGL